MREALWSEVIAPVVNFRPVLHLFIFGVALRLVFSDYEPMPLNMFFGPGALEMWAVMALAAPVVGLLGVIVGSSGVPRCRYVALWMRLLADVGLFTVLFSYHVGGVLHHDLTDSWMVSKYVDAAVVLYALLLVIVDVLILVDIEWRVRRGRP